MRRRKPFGASRTNRAALSRRLSHAVVTLCHRNVHLNLHLNLHLHLNTSISADASEDMFLLIP